eukprot:CAMPEP_0194328602 /NCGR_PEP_ID=MMETSP0171-20130528/45411_1 /TAXON_ID=218684 /ORGANISM="Corethron pennatum, Strain L29A3" /LENGTH=58 /DNA_ID=CAMNT_0039089011 /DNA_START=40 /DNA_END=212 /DNA_ORIENTATION=-
MNPERYQRKVFLAQEASAANARERQEEDTTKNGPSDVAQGKAPAASVASASASASASL